MEVSQAACAAMVISAPQGRSGKTIVTMALCASLKKKGMVVQPFKKGPDYIDPSWLTAASGRTCRNLDCFLIPEQGVIESCRKACRGADTAIIEGAMGLYDGPEVTGWGSTAHLAETLNVPVVLVVDCTRMTGSIAAMVRGYQQFGRDVNVAGVILNNVSGKRHERKLITAVESYCNIPVVGSIPRDLDLNLPQRHLGHVPFHENEGGGEIIERVCARLKDRFDLDTISTIAGEVKTDPVVQDDNPVVEKMVTIGVLRDRVFSFYYPENLEALDRAGARITFIDSLQDSLPDVDGLYIGGGFPEFFLAQLEANHGLRRSIFTAIEGGMPVYAECAGLMYLCEGIKWQNQWHEMVGTIPAEVELSDRPQGHGYVEVETVGENPLFPRGMVLRGHEFHHSKLTMSDGLMFAYRVKRGHGLGNGMDGIVYKNVLAAYTHLHALGAPEWARAFVDLVSREAGRQPVISASRN